MRATFIILLAALSANAALAHPVSLRGSTPVDDAQLAEVRGGFTSPDTGLAVSFGITREVYIDGSPAQSTLLPTSGGAGIVLVQRGAGNSFDVGSLSGLLNSRAAGTVVQNSLDNQNIQTITTLDVKSNSLSVLNGLNLRTSVSNGITASLRR